MKIVLFGATGMIGSRIAAEALGRGHRVTAVARDPRKLEGGDPRLEVVVGDVLSADSVAEVVRGADAVVSAVGPGLAPGADPQMLAASSHSLIEGLKRAGVKRVIVVGGAGSLEIAPGVQLVDTPEFPEAWKPGALAARDALKVWRGEAAAELEWTYFSPAALIEPGERTGAYRTGTEQLVADEQGNSRISAEDYAVALVDELERPSHVRARFTAAY